MRDERPRRPAATQQRGRQRRAVIVDAATRLVNERGFRQVTLKSIAEAADVPVASIYHYFPDVDALISAVAAGHIGRLEAAVRAVFERGAPSFEDLLHDRVDALHRALAAEPGLRELLYARRKSARMLHAYKDFRTFLAVSLWEQARQRLPDPGEPLLYQMITDAAAALWEFAFELDPDGNPWVVAEITRGSLRLLHRHGLIAEPPPRRGTRGGAPVPAAPSVGPWNAEPPRQERGRERRAAILNAAAEIVDEHGPHGAEVTLQAIADRAGVPMASVYHYFRDFDSVIESVVVTYMEELAAAIAEAHDATPPDSTAHAGRVIAACQEFFTARPGLRQLWFDRQATPGVLAVHAHFRRLIAEQSLAWVARRTGRCGQLVDYLMAIAAGAALWELAFALDPAGDPTVVREIRAMMTEFAEAL